MRPISNVVDVTNYVLLERNQPLHAFDLGKLAGRGIVVRRAEAGERMTTLDGVERELTTDDLLICDGARARRRSPGSWVARPRRCRSRPPRSCSSPRTSSGWGSPGPRSGSSSGPSRVPASSAASIPTASPATRTGRWSSSPRSRARDVSPEAVDEYPVPVERARIDAAHEPGEPAPRDVAHGHRGGRRAHAARDRGVGLGRRAGRARSDVPPRPRARDRPGRGGRAPGRLRRRSAARSPARPSRSARSRTRSATGASSPTRCVGAGLSEAITLPLVAPGDLARPAHPPTGSSRRRTRCAPRSPCCARASCRGSCGPSPTTAPGDSPTSRCSSSAGCSSLRTAGALLPDEPYHLAVALAGSVRRRPLDDDRPGRRVRRGRRAARRRRPRSRCTTGGSTPRPGPASTRAAPPPSRSAVPRSALVGEIDPRVVEALDLVRADRGARARPRRPARRRPARPRASGPRRRTRRRGSTSRSSSPTPWRPTRWPRRCAPPAVTSSRTSRCSTCSGPRRSAPAARASRSRSATGPPDRTLTDAEVAELRETAIAAVTAEHDAVLRG